MALMIELEPPKGGKGKAAEEMEEIASGEEKAETTAAQRTAGKAFAAAVKSGDGEAVWLAFEELCALHLEEEEGEEPESGEY
jgi:hypothetical protein